MRTEGVPLDFTLADFDMPVVRRQISETIWRLVPNEVQRIPASVEGHVEDYDILNVAITRRAVDESKSLITRWNAQHGWPEKVGQYFLVHRLRIDPQSVEGAEVFRLSGWEVAVIVSERVRRALLEQEVTGVTFKEV